jgi:AcrR family transcriptional regulator
LIAALATSIREKGYRETTVADIVRIARTSRRTFYEHFADRGACFLALFEQYTEARRAEIVAAVDPQAPLEEQIEAAIDVYLSGEARHPELQHSFVRELPGMSEGGAAAIRATLESFAEMLVALAAAAGERHPEAQLAPLSRDVAIILVGGMRELMVISVQDERDMRELRESSLQVVKAILGSLTGEG